MEWIKIVDKITDLFTFSNRIKFARSFGPAIRHADSTWNCCWHGTELDITYGYKSIFYKYPVKMYNYDVYWVKAKEGIQHLLLISGRYKELFYCKEIGYENVYTEIYNNEAWPSLIIIDDFKISSGNFECNKITAHWVWGDVDETMQYRTEVPAVCMIHSYKHIDGLRQFSGFELSDYVLYYNGMLVLSPLGDVLTKHAKYINVFSNELITSSITKMVYLMHRTGKQK